MERCLDVSGRRSGLPTRMLHHWESHRSHFSNSDQMSDSTVHRRLSRNTTLRRTILRKTKVRRTILRRTIVRKTILRRTIIRRTILRRTILCRTIIRKVSVSCFPEDLHVGPPANSYPALVNAGESFTNFSQQEPTKGLKVTLRRLQRTQKSPSDTGPTFIMSNFSRIKQAVLDSHWDNWGCV